MKLSGLNLDIHSALILLCVAASFVCSDSRSSEKRRSVGRVAIDNLTRSGIVPDLINRQPCYSVEVNYRGNLVVQGNELSVQQTRRRPRINYPNARRGKLYTIIMVDPDAPSREFPLASPFLHYMVINAPRANNLAGDTVVNYLGPSPPPATGFHRYVFLVYEQRGKITPGFMIPLVSRLRFSLGNFFEKTSLIGPVAANFFITQFTLE